MTYHNQPNPFVRHAPLYGPYFSYSPCNGLEYHNTLEEARDSAEGEIQAYRDDMDEPEPDDYCWDTEVEDVCYGKVIGRATRTEVPGRAYGVIDYLLKEDEQT